MTKKLKRIAPVKFGIIMGIFYGLLSLIIVPFFLLFSMIAALAPAHDESSAPHALVAGVGLVVGCVLVPIFYAIFGALIGMLMAWIYNVVASWVGGIEFEIE